MKIAMLWTGVLCCVVGSIALCSTKRLAAPQLTKIHFLGLTNGWVSPMSINYGKLSARDAAFVQSWLQDGTNAAILRITNDLRRKIELFPFADIETKSSMEPPPGLVCEPTFILDS